MSRATRLAASLAALLPAAAGAFGQTAPAGGEAPLNLRLGPSFPCPPPRDPLAELICNNADLARLDLAFVQTYQAYRQGLTPDAQRALRAESADFGRAMRSRCGIGNPPSAPAGGTTPPVPATAVACIADAYRQKRSHWETLLSATEIEEARRPLDQHVALQRDLQTLGLIPQEQVIDGVFGPSTRFAITSFQQAMSLPVTGLLGDDDADVLRQQVAARATAGDRRSPDIIQPEPPPVRRGMWQAFQGEALAAGVRASVSSGDGCEIALEVHDPQALGEAALAADGQSTGERGDETQVFKRALAFLSTRIAGKAVHAAFATRPAADTCLFTATAFTQDLYGRDVPQLLFRFGFDRVTYDKIVWDRFNMENMPKIVASLTYGAYAQERLRGNSPPAK